MNENVTRTYSIIHTTLLHCLHNDIAIKLYTKRRLSVVYKCVRLVDVATGATAHLAADEFVACALFSLLYDASQAALLSGELQTARNICLCTKIIFTNKILQLL